MTEYLPYFSVVAGITTLAISIFRRSGKTNLKETGIAAEGIIFDQEFDNNSNQTGNSFSSSVKDKITIRFITLDEEWITGTIQQGFGFFYSGQYKNGDSIKVYYNKDDPSEFYVDTKQSEFLGKLVFALAGLVLLLTGLYQLFAH